MNWFDNNPVGKALAWGCGGLAFISLLLTWAWNWPVSSGSAEAEQPVEAVVASTDQAAELGAISDYRVINDRPVFNESRQPMVTVDGEGEPIEFAEAPVANALDVRLTGVIITPEQRLATLSRNDGEALIAHEGNPLDGEYVGWTVTDIEPRMIRLESSQGESMELELTVHDQPIREPPKPEPTPAERQMAQEGVDPDSEETGAPMSRAEEIRQRIQERREQLRRDAEMEREQQGDQEAGTRSEYQQAIQSMLQRSRSDENEDDGSGSDDDE